MRRPTCDSECKETDPRLIGVLGVRRIQRADAKEDASDDGTDKNGRRGHSSLRHRR